jgi:pantoate kinase
MGEEKQNAVTLNVEELVDVIIARTQQNNTQSPFSADQDQHDSEAESLKKAWYNYMFLSLSKMGETVEALKSEMATKKELEKLSEKYDKVLDKLNNKIELMNNKLIMVTVKVSMWGALGGFGASCAIALISFLAKNGLGGG